MSAEEDRLRGRAEYGRRMRVRRITGSIQIAMVVVGIIIFVSVVIAIGNERSSIIAFMVIIGTFLGLAESGPVNRLAERIEAWLSSSMR